MHIGAAKTQSRNADMVKKTHQKEESKCYRCHKVGHIKKDCEEPASEYEKQKKQKRLEKKAARQAEAQTELRNRSGEPFVWRL